MKRIVIFTFFCLNLIVSAFSQVEDTSAVLSVFNQVPDSTSGRPSIGLVLSGGGARGFAHIGTLKLLDSLDIPIDYIAGTSMGGIIGALYAVGYSGEELEKFVMEVSWQDLFQDSPPRTLAPFFVKQEKGRYQFTFGMEGITPKPMSGMIFGQKIMLKFLELLFPWEHIHDFDDLPIPYRCIAADLITGNEVVLGSGSLARAVRATMSIPSLFSPVEWGDSLLVDGGMFNNLPVNIAKQMGAKLIIAVNVTDPLREQKDFETLLDVLTQSIDLLGVQRLKENTQMADILISPDLKKVNITDFTPERVMRIIERGDEAADRGLEPCRLLKDAYHLCRTGHPFVSGDEPQKQVISRITVEGLQNLSISAVYSRIHVKTGDIFDPGAFQSMLNTMKMEMPIEYVDYTAVPVADDSLSITVSVREKRYPLLYGIDIRGNERLPFYFIFGLLNIKPGYRIDPVDINQKITELYALGYFKYIHYTLEPVNDDAVRMIVTVREMPHRKVLLGVRYDDLHKLVASVALKESRLFVPGLRLDMELQFIGLTFFNTRLYYTSLAQNLPIYPYLDLGYKKINTSIFDEYGLQIAAYHDRSYRAGSGIGLLPSRALNVEVGFQYEWVDTKPDIAFPQPDVFPTWEERLMQIKATMRWDRLDNILLPHRGFMVTAAFEGSYRKLGSAQGYEKVNVSLDYYLTVLHRHTIRSYLFWGKSQGLPRYKFFNQGRPATFVGTEYDQVVGSGMSLFRMEYRFQLKENIYLKLMGNYIPEIQYAVDDNVNRVYNIYGSGIGVKFMSPLGPLEVIFASGRKSFAGPVEEANHQYYIFGMKF